MLQRRFLLTGSATFIPNSSNVIRKHYQLKEILDLGKYIKKPFHWGSWGSAIGHNRELFAIEIAHVSQIPKVAKAQVQPLLKGDC